MQQEDQDELRGRYRTRWESYGYDSRTLGWTKDCQWVRFKAAFEGLRQEDFSSVLDIGCGFGDLLGYLRGTGWQGRYRGVDLVEELIQEGRRRYAEDTASEFLCADAGLIDGSQKSDMAVALGIFNHRLRQDNLEYFRETLDTLWRVSSRVVVCDFLSTSSDEKLRREDLFYADPATIYRIASGYSRRLMIHHAYMPFEFQIKIWHDDCFETAAPVFRPYADLALAQTEWRKQVVKPTSPGDAAGEAG